MHFHRDSSAKDGLRSICKSCATDRANKWYADNAERAKPMMVNRYHSRKELYLQIQKSWAARNMDKKLASMSKRRAAKISAIPKWFGELDELAFAEAHDLCKLRQLATGFKWHVDHVIPLISEKVCGLHTYSNISVIPAKLNLSKGNRFPS